jgi:Arc/MetJ-type ribon-helix-helix transcriptional regulator
MGVKAVTVRIDEQKLARLDGWVRAGRYENRSKAVNAALELLERHNALPTGRRRAWRTAWRQDQPPLARLPRADLAVFVMQPASGSR